MATTVASRPESSAQTLTLAAHAAFVPIGVATVLLGPMLPWLSARWGMNYAQAGSLFTAQFAAATFGVILSGILSSRWGFRFAINTGLLIMGAGVALLPYGSHALGVACVAAYGFGYGVSIPAANLMVAEVNPTRRSAALNLLNFSWSVGAVACPFLIAAALRRHAIPLVLAVLGAVMLLVMLGIGATSVGTSQPAAKQKASAATSSLADLLHHHSFYVLAALFFLYVGTETAIGGWVATYAKSLSNATTLAVMTPSFFYIALMLGRWLAPLGLRRINEITFARAGILLSCIGMAALLWSHTIPAIAASASLAGFGLASVYPITISLVTRQFGRASTRVGSVGFTMANFGGASLPWLVGYSSTRFGAVKAGLIVPLVAGIAMLALYLTRWEAATVPP